MIDKYCISAMNYFSILSITRDTLFVFDDAKRSMVALVRVELLEADGMTPLEFDVWQRAGRH